MKVTRFNRIARYHIKLSKRSQIDVISKLLNSY